MVTVTVTVMVMVSTCSDSRPTIALKPPSPSPTCRRSELADRLNVERRAAVALAADELPSLPELACTWSVGGGLRAGAEAEGAGAAAESAHPEAGAEAAGGAAAEEEGGSGGGDIGSIGAPSSRSSSVGSAKVACFFSLGGVATTGASPAGGLGLRWRSKESWRCLRTWLWEGFGSGGTLGSAGGTSSAKLGASSTANSVARALAFLWRSKESWRLAMTWSCDGRGRFGGSGGIDTPRHTPSAPS